MKKRKYELSNECIEWCGRKLYRIRSLIDRTSDIKVGTLGGYVESEKNLSQDGCCWIYDNAKVAGNARVERYAKIRGNTIIDECAVITDYADVNGDIFVGGNARISEYAHVSGSYEIHGAVRIHGHAKLSGGCISIYDRVEIDEEVEMSGCFELNGDSKICGDAIINSASDFCIIRGFGLQYDEIMFVRSKKYNVAVFCDDWGYISINKFRNEVRKKYKKTMQGKDYIMLAEVMEHKLLSTTKPWREEYA